jgi:hypothetical protein
MSWRKGSVEKKGVERSAKEGLGVERSAKEGLGVNGRLGE